MFDKLGSIGFYTLTDERAKNVTDKTPLWRCELLLTSNCNFKCPYCRGVKKEDAGNLSWDDAYKIINIWGEHNLKNVRFSGGEPTLWKHLPELIKLSKHNGIDRIAISTNGSAPLSLYKELIDSGVNDFSISLDGCCASTGNKMAGGIPIWDHIIENIKNLSSMAYVTIGIVITEDNDEEVDRIIDLADKLGVSDIRLITASHRTKYLYNISSNIDKYPILKYRLNNFRNGRPIRGISETDNHRCPLVLDDMAVLNNKHYPCIIYLREHGKEIEKIGQNIREERLEWYINHDCYKDPICRNNCLDVCVDYNNRVRELNKYI